MAPYGSGSLVGSTQVVLGKSFRKIIATANSNIQNAFDTVTHIFMVFLSIVTMTFDLYLKKKHTLHIAIPPGEIWLQFACVLSVREQTLNQLENIDLN